MTGRHRRGPVVAEPLPECEMCETPTKRDVWEQNGHLCTDCSSGIADTVRMLLPAGVTDLATERQRRRRLEHLAADQDDATVYVERYLPPVPGQLAIGCDVEDGWCVTPSHDHSTPSDDPR